VLILIFKPDGKSIEHKYTFSLAFTATRDKTQKELKKNNGNTREQVLFMISWYFKQKRQQQQGQNKHRASKLRTYAKIMWVKFVHQDQGVLWLVFKNFLWDPGVWDPVQETAIHLMLFLTINELTFLQICIYWWFKFILLRVAKALLGIFCLLNLFEPHLPLSRYKAEFMTLAARWT